MLFSLDIHVHPDDESHVDSQKLLGHIGTLFVNACKIRGISNNVLIDFSENCEAISTLSVNKTGSIVMESPVDTALSRFERTQEADASQNELRLIVANVASEAPENGTETQPAE